MLAWLARLIKRASREAASKSRIPLRITGKFPGYLSPSAGLKFADVPNGLAAISKANALGMEVVHRVPEFEGYISRAEKVCECFSCR